MKVLGNLIIVFGLVLCSCNQSTHSNTDSKIETPTSNIETSTIENQKDKTEILNLIRETLKWADSKNSIDLFPVIADRTDSIYIGFDLNQLDQNLIKLENAGFFTNEFIENYNQIILKLDKKLKANEFEHGPWLVGDIPPFNFASDLSPWCLCQDNAEWDLVEIEQTKENDYIWKWGGQNWKDFSYKFKVVKEESSWKVSYLDGFNISKINI